LYEAIVLAKLRHPNIVAFYGVSLTKTHLHIAMELVPPTPKGDASDLFNLMQEAIDTQQTLENSIIRGILVDVLRALIALHTHVPTIVHRDVKPENVLVRENFSCALTDFGSAAPAGVRFSPAGTLHYMLPDATLVFAALDIYAFGVTAVQLICAAGFLTAVDPKQVMTGGEISELTNTVLSSLSTPVCKALKMALLKPREITASELLKSLTVGKFMSSSHAASTEMPTE
jgi:serine/threonine protein kinase